MEVMQKSREDLEDEELPLECPHCHSKVQDFESVYRTWVFITLLIMGIFPGIIYRLFRRNTYRCPVCEKTF